MPVAEATLGLSAKMQTAAILAQQVPLQREVNDGVGAAVLHFGKRGHPSNPGRPVRTHKVGVLKDQSKKLLHKDVIRS
jgi:hypothetical protein